MGHAYTSVTKYELLALSAFDYSTGETEIHMYIDFDISYCVVSYTTILQNVNEMGETWWFLKIKRRLLLT